MPSIGLHRGVDARVLRPREELGVVAGPGADAVEVAVLAVEPVGELLVHHRTLGELEVGHVAGQPDQDRLAGLRVDAGHGHGVGAQAPAARAGVAAEQQHVVAAVRGVADRAVAEHRDDEVALDADQVGAEEQRAGHREAEHTVDADHGEALVLDQGQRLTQPPGVDEQARPADRQQHQHQAQQRRAASVLDAAQNSEPVPDRGRRQPSARRARTAPARRASRSGRPRGCRPPAARSPGRNSVITISVTARRKRTLAARSGVRRERSEGSVVCSVG